MESQTDDRRVLRCIALLSGFDEWPDNEFTRELRTWPDKFADDPEVECPKQEILDKAATLSDTIPSDFMMVIDANGGVVYEAEHGKYHIWNNGEVEWIAMRNGKVADRCVIPFARNMIKDDSRAPVDRDGPVIRKSIGATTVSKPTKTQRIIQHYAIGRIMRVAKRLWCWLTHAKRQAGIMRRCETCGNVFVDSRFPY